MTVADGPRRFHDRVRFEASHDGTVGWLVMERGEGPANAFDVSMVHAMTEALGALPDSAGCMVLRGEGEFSVGADLATVRDTPPDDRPAVLREIAGASNGFIRALRRLEVPSVAAVNGTAAGGGLGFALACDVIAMHADAVVDPAYARIGLTPDNSTPYFLARTLGPYQARDLLFAPHAVGADEAHELGLASRVIPAGSFDEEVGEYAVELARIPSSVQVTTRSLVDTAYTDALDAHLERQCEAISRAAETPPFVEGLAAFFEGREPDW